MIYGSVCSGIEAASVAWHPLGWRAAFLSEIEAFPRAVLAHHYPTTPLHGDFTTIEAGEYEPIDLLVGGTPCQDFSVAGLRAGMAGDRGNLTLQFLTLARRLRPKWLVWENVPGVLSSNGGRDFGAFLGGLGELGYGWAYRTLDAQFFGVAQRRRRVFVVGYLGDWRRAAAVLFERHNLSGDSAPRREKGEGASVSPSLRARANSSHRADSQAFIPDVGYALNAHGGAHGGAHGRQDAESETLIAPPLTSNPYGDHESREGLLVAHTLKGEGFDASEDGTGRGTPLVACEPYTLAIRGREGGHNLEYRDDGTANAILTPNGGRAGIGVGAIAFGGQMSTVQPDAELSQTLQAKNPQAVATTSAVRRLTPRECERLQGFPDDYTLIPWRRGMASDGPRYKALGNSMAVPVMAWIGRRIAMVEALPERAAA